jgi:hypothetical protein
MPAHKVPPHVQSVTHRYAVRYPEHGPREGDPAYIDFEHYRRTHIATARCQFAIERGDDSECDKEHPLELHHSHVEWAMLNEVDFALLEPRYPGISDPSTVGKWAETGENLEFRCRFHHRGPGGVHTASAADYEASHFIRNLLRS